MSRQHAPEHASLAQNNSRRIFSASYPTSKHSQHQWRGTQRFSISSQHHHSPSRDEDSGYESSAWDESSQENERDGSNASSGDNWTSAEEWSGEEGQQG